MCKELTGENLRSTTQVATDGQLFATFIICAGGILVLILLFVLIPAQH